MAKLESSMKVQHMYNAIKATVKFNIEGFLKQNNSEIMNMQYSVLREQARGAFKAANQRASRLEKLGLSFTPALDAYSDGGGRFYLRGFGKADQAQINQLRAEVFRAKRFLSMKTSTVSKARKYDAKMKQTLGGEVTRENGVRVWELYRKAEQENFAGIQAYGSDNVAQMIYQSMDNMSDGDILSYIQDVLSASYETAQEQMEEAMADDFFDLW